MKDVKTERKKFDRVMKKNILVVDDSALMRRAICDIINAGNDFEATDTCRDGLEAYEKIKNGSYAAVLLDINMPRMNGLELLQRLRKENIPATVIIVSSLAKEEAPVTLKALDYGALDFITKPTNIVEAKGAEFRTALEALVNSALSKNKKKTVSLAAAKQGARQTVKAVPKKQPSGDKKLVAVACSTGGPRSLQSVVPYLDKALDAPVVLVQHMPSGFTRSMAERLNELSKVEVKEAEENDILKKGCVYVAPGGYHLEIVPLRDSNHKIHLSDAPPIGGLRPCANVMYKSLKRSSFDQIICVVLTGMGADGTEGIRDLNQTKPIYVISQDEASCVVYGMPKAIVEAGLSDEVVPLTGVPKSILNQVGVK